MARAIDISVPVRPGKLPHWPGSPAVRFEHRLCLAHGDNADDTNISLSVHTGTHLDAPSHFIAGAPTIDQVPLEAMVGPCFVAECRGVARIDAATLEAAGIPAGTSRLLLKTDNEHKWGPEFDPSFVALDVDAARWVADRGMKLVGIDYLSVQPYGDSDDVHKLLLGADVVILEGLNLALAEPGPYNLLCLPIRLEGIEGAPARALLLPPDAAITL